MQLTMLVLMVGTLLVFIGRAHVQIRSGVPPRSWLPVELILASGPGFGWGCAVLGPSTQSILLAMAWLLTGILCYVAGRVVARKYSERLAKKNMFEKIGNDYDPSIDPMMMALITWREVDRSFDFDDFGEKQEQVARSRRDKLVAMQ